MIFENDEILLRAAGDLIAARRLERFDEWNARERAFSPRAGKRLARLAKKERRRAGRSGSRRWSLRTAVAVAVLVFLSVTAIAAGPIQETLVKARTSKNENDGYVTFQYDVQFNRPEGEAGARKMPTYMTEGYSLCKDERIDNIRVLEYEAGGYWDKTKIHNGQYTTKIPKTFINITSFPLGDEDSVPWYGITEEEFSAVQVGEYEGVTWTGECSFEGYTFTNLVWSDGYYQYILMGYIDLEEALRIAENMK